MNTPTFLLMLAMICEAAGGASGHDGFVFPGQQWARRSPQQAGFSPQKWTAFLADVERNAAGYSAAGQNPDGKYGCVIVRHGYLVAEIGDPDLMQNSASVGKAFNKIALQLAIDHGIIRNANDRISSYWTGRGLFDDPAKEMDQGHHAQITWRHLAEMQGGFPITSGFNWERKQDIPPWAQWTGDPTADNRAHRAPGGNTRHYSSGGQWRLNQALTAVIGKELKTFLDEQLFSKIGIQASAWRWETGRTLKENRHWYPDLPGYGGFCDPPYEINGHRVQGGGGWVFMTPRDLARIGLLVATAGQWNGQQLISKSNLLAGHAGFGPTISLMDGDPNTGIVIGKVNWAARQPSLTLEEIDKLLADDSTP